MDEIVSIQTDLKTTAEYKSAFASLLAAMTSLDEQMDKQRAESERLKVETQVIKARADANLLRLQAQIDDLSRKA